jgi:phage tail sheath gpL-like
LAHPTEAAASGTITCSAKANLDDNDTITIGDGLTAPKVYEFDTAGDGVTAGNVQVDVSTDTTAATVAARLRTAILAAQPAFDVLDNADGTLTLTHKWPGAGGNVTITENVTHASFTVTGMSGGVGGPANATATYKLFTADRAMALDTVEYIPSASIAAHAANHWTLQILKNATVIASWSTDSDVADQGALTADTPVTLVNSTTAGDLEIAADDVISVKVVKGGTIAPLRAGIGTLRMRAV